jgi:hypothetical protein
MVENMQICGMPAVGMLPRIAMGVDAYTLWVWGRIDVEQKETVSIPIFCPGPDPATFVFSDALPESNLGIDPHPVAIAAH